MKGIGRATGLLFAALYLLLVSGCGPAGGVPPDWVARYRAATVLVKNTAGDGRVYMGAGLLLPSPGVVLTTERLVEGGAEIKVGLLDRSCYVRGSVCGENAFANLSVIRIEEREPLRGLHWGEGILGDPTKVEMGEEVLVFGFPFGDRVWNEYRCAVHRGMVSLVVEKRPEGEARPVLFFQIDGLFNAGHVGGPVVSLRTGRVIALVDGVMAPSLSGELQAAPESGLGIAKAVAVNEARRLLEVSLSDRGRRP